MIIAMVLTRPNRTSLEQPEFFFGLDVVDAGAL